MHFKLLPVLLLASAAIPASAQIAQLTKRVEAPSELRARLRIQALQLVPELRHRNSFLEGADELALPLAQLGDWNAALRLSTKPHTRDSLFHWRAIRLADAGKFNQSREFATQIRDIPTRADALMFAARRLIERGNWIGVGENGLELRLLLEAAAQTPRSDQLAYLGYLWNRAGGFSNAKQVFTRAAQQARLDDATSAREHEQFFRDSKTPVDKRPPAFRNYLTSVLRLSAHAGMLRQTAQSLRSDETDLLFSLMESARTADDLRFLRSFVDTSPAPWRSRLLSKLATAAAIQRQTVLARAWFDEVEILWQTPVVDEASPPLASQHERAVEIFFFGIVLVDEALTARGEQLLREVAARATPSDRFFKLEEISVAASFFQLTGAFGTTPLAFSRAQLDELSAPVETAPPSDLKFRTLQTLAALYANQKQMSSVRRIAGEMLQTARALAAEERARFQKKDTFFDPYFPSAPRLMDVALWLRIGGDDQTARTIATEFASTVPARQKPYAAMMLTRAHFFDLADSLFDPRREVRAYEARLKQPNRPDWASEFMSFGAFAANEARFRAPDAPARWFGAIQNHQIRAGVLKEWIGAFDSQPVVPKPYIRVQGGSSSASY